MMRNYYQEVLQAQGEFKYKDALEILKTGAENGDGMCMWWLGECYNHGYWISTESNDEKAQEWYKKSADVGNPRGMYEVAEYIEFGTKSASFEDYKNREKQANMIGLKIMKCDDDLIKGHCYNNRRGVDYDHLKAKKYYQKEAKRNDPFGQYWFANINATDHKDFQKNYNIMIEYFRKSAEQGYVLAQYTLADCLDRGFGIEMNCEEAQIWFRKAADQGFDLAIDKCK